MAATPRPRVREAKVLEVMDVPWEKGSWAAYAINGWTVSRGTVTGLEPLEHALHSGNFRSLVHAHVVGQLGSGLFPSRALGAEELIHHGDGTLVVLNHVGQK